VYTWKTPGQFEILKSSRLENILALLTQL